MKQTLPSIESDEDERPAPTGMSEATKLEPEKAESKKPKSFKEAFAAAEDGSTFEWNGKKYKKEYAKPTAAPAPAPKASAPAPKASAPAPAPKPAPKAERSGDQYSGRAEIAKRFGTQSMRDEAKPDIKAEDVEAAKKAGEERRRRHSESLSDSFKRIGAKIGSQSMRDKYKEEGYAKGGSVGSASRRADGCAQRGKTRGKIV